MSTQEKTTKKRICYLAPDVAIPSPRGSSVHVDELARNLSELGHCVHVVCRRVRSTEPSLEEVNGYTIHRIYRWIIRPEAKSSFTSDKPSEYQTTSAVKAIYFLYLLTIFRIYAFFVTARITRKYKLELIIERETSFGAGALAAFFTRIPLILEIIGPRYSRLSTWRSSKILYYTESMLRSWVDRKKCVAVAAGANLSLFCPNEVAGKKVRVELGLNSDDAVVGYVGTFQNWHGIGTLLKASNMLKEEFPNLKLLLVGPNFDNFKFLSENLGISNHCIFRGPVDYGIVPSYINACDVMTALYEPMADPLRMKYGIGWPIKILEYLACAKPVVATNVDPVPKIISNSALGVLVTPGDSTELARELKRLLTDHDLATNLGVNGRIDVVRKYSWAAVANDISSLTESIGV